MQVGEVAMRRATLPARPVESTIMKDTFTRFRRPLLAVVLAVTAMFCELGSVSSVALHYVGGDSAALRDLLHKLTSFVIAIVVTGCLLSASDIFRSLRSSAPGPRLAKITHGWKAFHIRNGTYQHRLKGLHRKYGVIVQVSPNEYSVDDPTCVWKCKLVKASACEII